jgi:hypothetical protein
MPSWAEDRGVVGGSHWGKDGFDVAAVLVLGLVDDQEMVGGVTSGKGLGMGGEEGDTGFPQASAIGADLAFPLPGVPGVVQVAFEAFDRHAQAVADGAEDDLTAGSLEQVQEVGEHLAHGLVLPCLAGKDDEEL